MEESGKGGTRGAGACRVPRKGMDEDQAATIASVEGLQTSVRGRLS